MSRSGWVTPAGHRLRRQAGTGRAHPVLPGDRGARCGCTHGVVALRKDAAHPAQAEQPARARARTRRARNRTSAELVEQDALGRLEQHLGSRRTRAAARGR
jgi:hypothetical protein